MKFEPLKNYKNIVIVGMPGVGKSTVSKVLAQKINLSFIDSDDVIEFKENLTLAKIIQKKGLDGFLKAEEQHVSEIRCEGHVIATGGSVVYSRKIMEHFKADCFIIYLYVDLDVLLTRLGDLTARGVVISPGRNIEDLFYERSPLYETYCDLKIDCGTNLPDEVVKIILAAL